MLADIESRLRAHPPTETLTRLVQGVLEHAPGGEPLPTWTSWTDGARALGLSQDSAEVAPAHAASPHLRQALRALDGLDEGEGLFSIASGLGTALRLALSRSAGGRSAGLAAMDVQQRTDAADKVLTLAYVLTLIFGDSGEEAVRQLQALPSGRSLVTWLAISELFLPFMDDAAADGRLASLLDAERAGAEERLAAATNTEEAALANAQWPALAATLTALAESAAKLPLDLHGVVSRYVPRAVVAADAAGAVAAGAFDTLPVYHLLGARLIAEVALTGKRAHAVVISPPSPAVRTAQSSANEASAPAHDVSPDVLPFVSDIGDFSVPIPPPTAPPPLPDVSPPPLPPASPPPIPAEAVPPPVRRSLPPPAEEEPRHPARPSMPPPVPLPAATVPSGREAAARRAAAPALPVVQPPPRTNRPAVEKPGRHPALPPAKPERGGSGMLGLGVGAMLLVGGLLCAGVVAVGGAVWWSKRLPVEDAAPIVSPSVSPVAAPAPPAFPLPPEAVPLPAAPIPPAPVSVAAPAVVAPVAAAAPAPTTTSTPKKGGKKSHKQGKGAVRPRRRP